MEPNKKEMYLSPEVNIFEVKSDFLYLCNLKRLTIKHMERP